ncbi:hypothetical protein ACHAXS_012493 [Conticribra weissflogii]
MNFHQDTPIAASTTTESMAHYCGLHQKSAANLVLLNNLGVECLEKGGLPDASKCFHDAIDAMSSIFQDCHSVPTTNQFDNLPVPRSSPPTFSPSRSSSPFLPQPVGQNNVTKQDSSLYNVIEAKQSSESRSSRRTEYDEGMNSYSHPLRIDSSSHGFFHTAPILLFNLGRLHVMNNDDETAMRYFLNALDIIQQRPIRNDVSFYNGIGEHVASTISPDEAPIDALPILHNLGHIYYRSSNYEAAMNMYSTALKISQFFHHGSIHNLSSASAHNCIGVLHFHMAGEDDAKKSLHHFQSSLAILERLCATEAAMNTYVKALILRRELLPPNHLDLAATAYNLGQTYHQLGYLDEAMPLYTEFHRIVSERLGENHRDVAVILKCMAQISHDKCNYKEAASLYYSSLSKSKLALGELHPEVASTLNKIGNVHYESSEFEAAIQAYEQGLAVERQVLQNNHPNVIVTLTNIAQSHKHMGNYMAALERYLEAYSLQRTAIDPNDPLVAITLSNVAQVCCRLGFYSRALDAYQEVLRIRRDAYGDDHIDVASTLNSIGLVLFKQGYYKLAIESFNESLRVRRMCLGSQHRDVAVVLYNIATTHLEQGDDDAAMSYYKETLQVERSILGNDHRDLAVTLQHIGQVHRQRGELAKALEYFHEVLRIEKLNLGERNITIARILNKIGNIYLQVADVPNMMIFFAEASRIFQSLPSSDEQSGAELEITGYNFYGLSIAHPECAAAA